MLGDGSLGMAMGILPPLHSQPLQPTSQLQLQIQNDEPQMESPASGAVEDSGVSTPILYISDGQRKEDRLPQWGYHETKDLISIRAELELSFTQTKRNKTLWELISRKMKEKGFRRSADQCKCKWKNLVNRYKDHMQGKEISDSDNGRQCPFFEELDEIFTNRVKNMDRVLLESEGNRHKKKEKKLKAGDNMMVKFSDDDTEDEEDDGDDSEDDQIHKKKKRKIEGDALKGVYRANNMQEVLEEFFHQQKLVEEQWREALERRYQERQLREQQWRESMHRLEQERMMREQAWWERQEQRRAQAELRSQKWDELLAAVINKIVHEEG